MLCTQATRIFIAFLRHPAYLLLSTKCHVFNDIIFFCSNDMFFLNHVWMFKYRCGHLKVEGSACYAVEHLWVLWEMHKKAILIIHVHWNYIYTPYQPNPFSASSKNVALLSLSHPYRNNRSVSIVGQNELFWMIYVVKGYLEEWCVKYMHCLWGWFLGADRVKDNLTLYGLCIILQYICNPTGYILFYDSVYS